MADYYSILARAVSGLATNNARARQELYEHARTFFIAQLRRQDPQLSALESIRQSIALETAILRVEAESRSERSPRRLQITFRCLMLTIYRILLRYCVSLSCQRQAPIIFGSGSLRPLHT